MGPLAKPLDTTLVIEDHLNYTGLPSHFTLENYRRYYLLLSCEFVLSHVNFHVKKYLNIDEN